MLFTLHLELSETSEQTREQNFAPELDNRFTSSEIVNPFTLVM